MAEHIPTSNDSHERHHSETSYPHLSNQVITPSQALHAWGLQGAQKDEGWQSSEFTPYQAGVSWGLQGAQEVKGRRMSIRDADDAAYREEVAAWKARKLQGSTPPQPLPQLSTQTAPLPSPPASLPPHPYTPGPTFRQLAATWPLHVRAPHHAATPPPPTHAETANAAALTPSPLAGPKPPGHPLGGMPPVVHTASRRAPASSPRPYLHPIPPLPSPSPPQPRPNLAPPGPHPHPNFDPDPHALAFSPSPSS